MKRFIILAVLVGGLAARAFGQTTPIFQNFGSEADNPQIDAIAFANYGSFSTFSSLPYDFQNTLYFTNRGTMTANPGFRFATASSGQPPFKPAVSFVNGVNATIMALDSAGSLSAAGSAGAFGSTALGNYSNQIITPSYVLVSADSIVNYGYLIAGAAGLAQIEGNNVDLTRGAVGINRIEDTSTHFETLTTFFPDPAIYDIAWAGLTQQAMRVSGLLSIRAPRTNANGGPFGWSIAPAASTFPPFPPLSVVISNTNSTLSVFTNMAPGLDPTTGKPTNITRQAVFVQVSNTNFTSQVLWAPPVDPASLFMSPVIQIQMADTNVLTGQFAPDVLYLEDTLASNTNLVLLTNLAAYPTTYRPAVFVLARGGVPLPDWLNGVKGKGTLTNTFFYNPNDTNSSPVVTNTYAAYAALVDDLASPVPTSPGADVTEAPGRVEIVANTLNLTRTRLRGTGLISIQTQNLLGNSNVNVDGENVAFDLSAPAGAPLKVQNLVKPLVTRLNGTVAIWSAIFTNQIGLAATVSVPTASGGTTNVATNVLVEVDEQMVIVDATGLFNTKPVITRDFVTHADTVTLSDPVTVDHSLLIDTPSFTLDSLLTLQPPVSDFGSTNAPRLASMTITTNGLFSIPNVGNFGQDTAGLTAFTNNGYVSAAGLLIRSTTFVNSGTLTSLVEGISIETQTGQFTGATTASANDLTITGTDLTFTGSTNQSGGVMTLSATSSLSDSGPASSNLFITLNGFQMPVKPATGDLLGTTLSTIGPRFASVDHTWAGEDRGPNASGFQNNEALGALVLGGDLDTTLNFRGATGGNGLYVNMLELTAPLTDALAAGDLSSALTVDPSLTIYFVTANVDAGQLQQQSGGRIVQVSGVNLPQGFVPAGGPYGDSSAFTPGSGSTGSNGSNGSGSGNGTGAAQLQLFGVRTTDQSGIILSWKAQPQSSYQVEYTTSLQSPNWQVLSTFSSSGSAPQTATVQDQLPDNHSQRYYRVRSN